MALRTADVLGVGVGAGDLASLISGGLQSPVAAAGATLATATPTIGDVVVVGATGSVAYGGIRLRDASKFPAGQVVVNYSGNPIAIYPYASTNYIGTSAVGASYGLGNIHCAQFAAIASGDYVVINSRAAL